MVAIYTSFWKGLLQGSNFFFLTFIKHFLRYWSDQPDFFNKWSPFMHPSDKAFAKLQLFFLHFNKSFFKAIYDTKIQIFFVTSTTILIWSTWLAGLISVTSTTKSSIKVKILIWSTNGHLLCILLTSAFAKLKLFFLHFYEAFFTAIRDQNSHLIFKLAL